MDRRFACPHCRQEVALAPSATALQVECPYCRGQFVVGPAMPEEPAMPTLNITPTTATEHVAADRSSFDRSHIKYIAAAGVMLAMALVPVLGYAIVRWSSQPERGTTATAAAPVPVTAADNEIVLTGTVIKTEPESAAAGKGPQRSEPNAPGATSANATASAPRQSVSPSPSPPPSASNNPTAAFSGEVAATGGAAGDTTALVQRVEPSVVVVQVTLEKGSSIGSGFPLDDQGTIVTNYHVIEGAKSAKIKFGQKTADIEGFLVFAPGKDIAILKAKLEGERVAPLKLASGKPAKGETVLTFGAPLGFDSTVSNGIVSSVRKGTDLQEIFKKMVGADIYVEQQHYDPDAVWVQTTAPISGGNSGGPLVNLRGEVVGLNTWGLTKGQNMNFAISADHIKELMATAKSGVHPLAELPEPREHEAVAGNGRRTLEYWEEVSKINRALANRLKTVRQPPIPTTQRQLVALFPKLAGTYKKLGDMLPETAARLKALKIDDVDEELVALVTVDAILLEKIGAEARDLSADAKGLRLEKVVLYDSEKLAKKAYGEFEKLELGQAYDVLRIRMTNRYGLTFASIFDAGSRSKSASKPDDEDVAADDSQDTGGDDAQREKQAAGKLKIAKSLKDAGKRDAAKDRLQQVVDEFAGTKAADEAQKLLDELGE